MHTGYLLSQLLGERDIKRLYYFLSSNAGNFFIVNGITALAYSLILPILSLFLIEGLGFEPISIGIYTVSYAVAGIVISQKFGALADNGVDGKKLFIIGLIGMGLAALSYALLTQFWQILNAGTLFMGLARASIPMILTMVRRFAETSGLDATSFNAQIRSSVSLIWIVGPPLAFLSVEKLGFQINFLIAAALALVVVFYAGKVLPKSYANSTQAKDASHKAIRLPKRVFYLGVVIFFGNLANANYGVAMPLYLTNELSMAMSTPGLLLGLTAACEIPVMLMAAKWAQAIGSGRLLIISFAMAIIFYLLCQWAQSLYTFLMIQVFNGLFFGMFVGIGISFLQDEAKDAIGKATAFYSNMMALGNMAGAACMGVIAQYLGYKEAMLFSLLCASIAFVMMVLFELYGAAQKRNKHHIDNDALHLVDKK